MLYYFWVHSILPFSSVHCSLPCSAKSFKSCLEVDPDWSLFFPCWPNWAWPISFWSFWRLWCFAFPGLHRRGNAAVSGKSDGSRLCSTNWSSSGLTQILTALGQCHIDICIAWLMCQIGSKSVFTLGCLWYSCAVQVAGPPATTLSATPTATSLKGQATHKRPYNWNSRNQFLNLPFVSFWSNLHLVSQKNYLVDYNYSFYIHAFTHAIHVSKEYSRKNTGMAKGIGCHQLTVINLRLGLVDCMWAGLPSNSWKCLVFWYPRGVV